jgi:hypothetical protein
MYKFPTMHIFQRFQNLPKVHLPNKYISPINFPTEQKNKYLINNVLFMSVFQNSQLVHHMQIRVHKIKNHIKVFIIFGFYYTVLKNYLFLLVLLYFRGRKGRTRKSPPGKYVGNQWRCGMRRKPGNYLENLLFATFFRAMVFEVLRSMAFQTTP